MIFSKENVKKAGVVAGAVGTAYFGLGSALELAREGFDVDGNEVGLVIAALLLWRSLVWKPKK